MPWDTQRQPEPRLASPGAGGLQLAISDGTVHTIPGTCLLTFVDETGDESLRDPKFPVFGFGGIVVRCDAYVNSVLPSWLTMKRQVFGNENYAFHAKEANKEERKAVSAWFRSPPAHPIGVVGTALTDSAKIDDFLDLGSRRIARGHGNFAAVSHALTQRVYDVWISVSFDRVALIIETSERAAGLSKEFLAWETKATDGGPDVQIDRYTVAKKLGTPGLEMADHVARAAGRQAHLGPPPRLDPDFRAVFQAPRSGRASYLRIDRAERTS